MLPDVPCRLRRARGHAGFTLIEVLVAVGLTSIMLWGLLQLFTGATRFTATVATDSELCAGGRAVLERMARELASAASLEIGYIKITKKSETIGGKTHYFDSIQFVSPVADGGCRYAHVYYFPEGASGSTPRLLKRATKDTGSLGSVPTLTSYTTSASFGLNVDSFRIRHKRGSEDPSDSGGRLTTMPRAILIEIRLTDRKRSAVLTLSTAAYLPAAGI